MKVAVYARISTSDEDQNPETQLMPLLDYCAALGWKIVSENMDHAPANDQAHRTAWREQLDGDGKREFSVVLAFELDRAFRSVKHMHDTLAAWELVGVGFKTTGEAGPGSKAGGHGGSGSRRC